MIPTLLQIPVETDRTVVALFKLLQKHASIPFVLRKPTSLQTIKVSYATEGLKSSTPDDKYELSRYDLIVPVFSNEQ